MCQEKETVIKEHMKKYKKIMYGMMLWKRESIYNSSINTMNINKNIYFIEIYQMFSYYQFSLWNC